MTPSEDLLASLWSTVLGQPTIQREDNFFELGGHSLLATRVVAQVRQAFSVELPVRTLFEQPTLAHLAAAVDTLKAGSSASWQPIVPIERSGPLPLSDAQQRQWVLAQLEPDSPFYCISTAIRITGELFVDLLQQSLEQLVARHEVLRVRVREEIAVEARAVGLVIDPQHSVEQPALVRMRVADLVRAGLDLPRVGVRAVLAVDRRAPG